TGSDSTLGIVDFAIFPHLDNEDLPENTMANAEKWAAGMGLPCYAIDDQTAIRVTDGTVEVVSEGHWKLFTPRFRLIATIQKATYPAMAVVLTYVHYAVWLIN